MERLQILQTKSDACDKEINESNRIAKKNAVELNKAIEEMKKLEKEREDFQGELNKMKSHMDPTSLTLSDVMKKLR